MRKRRLTVGAAVAVTAVMALGTGLAAAQSQSPSSTTTPATASAPPSDGTEAMNQMHEAMLAQMPDGLRSQAEAMHAQMQQANNGMGAMMQTMMGAGGPPARPGG